MIIFPREVFVHGCVLYTDSTSQLSHAPGAQQPHVPVAAILVLCNPDHVCVSAHVPTRAHSAHVCLYHAS